jgi:CheY-like chemotaxis protein/rubrerythrin
MQNIIKRLRHIEYMAGDVYGKAAEYFKDDGLFSEFLAKTAEDETWHYHALTSAAEHLKGTDVKKPAISFDEQVREKLEAIFRGLESKITNQTLTKDEMVDAIAGAELSEWNPIALYVVNTLKTIDRTFNTVAISLQQHKRSIEYFFEQFPELQDKIKTLKQLPSVWNEKILIVEDNQAIAELLKEILNSEGNIDIAENGQRGLENVKMTYYKLIISDIDMPLMDGTEFFNEVLKIHPCIGSRFLFFTGNPDQENLSFFSQNNVKYLIKPAKLDQIKKNALAILLEK